MPKPVVMTALAKEVFHQFICQQACTAAPDAAHVYRSDKNHQVRYRKNFVEGIQGTGREKGHTSD